MRRLLWMIVIAAAVAAGAQNAGYQPDPNWKPPAEASARSNPLAARKDLAAGGHKLFVRHCAECHGEDGSGLKKAANLQMAVVQEQSDGALHWKITHGNSPRGMPSFSSLPELQRWQIVLYLRTLGKKPEKELSGP